MKAIRDILGNRRARIQLYRVNTESVVVTSPTSLTSKRQQKRRSPVAAKRRIKETPESVAMKVARAEKAAKAAKSKKKVAPKAASKTTETAKTVPKRRSSANSEKGKRKKKVAAPSTDFEEEILPAAGVATENDANSVSAPISVERVQLDAGAVSVGQYKGSYSFYRFLCFCQCKNSLFWGIFLPF